MEIKLLNSIHQAKQAKGIVIVIDVLRAASVEAYLFSKGVKFILPVNSEKNGLKLKMKYKNAILIGENSGKKLPNYDYNNSPSKILEVDFKDKIVIHCTSHGTKALHEINNAEYVIFGSLVTCNAILKFIKSKSPKVVSILSLGLDDELVAEYYHLKLINQKINEHNLKQGIEKLASLKGYGNPKMQHYPIEDLALCLDIDRFNFFCSVRRMKKELRTVQQFS